MRLAILGIALAVAMFFLTAYSYADFLVRFLGGR